MPRIIAGIKKGMRLQTPKGDRTRPTGDKAKEALFSILDAMVHKATVLDLFAGSGQIGLEALSRGASFSVFVETAGSVRRCLFENIRHTGFEDVTRVLPVTASAGCRRLAAAGQTFDLIYVDPPWQDHLRLVKSIDPFLAKLLKADGILVIEEPKMLETAPCVTGLEHYRRCRYGGAMLSFYKNTAGTRCAR